MSVTFNYSIVQIGRYARTGKSLLVRNYREYHGEDYD